MPTTAPVAIPTTQQVLGATIEQLVCERVNAQPDVANLDYVEREYRASVERQKLYIQYFELTGQFDKATLWTAQLRKGLEQSTQPRRNETSQKSRENREALEAEHSRLSEQLAEARAAAMTDAELEPAMKSPSADIAVDYAGDNAGIEAITTAELTAGISQMKRELARYEAEAPVVTTAEANEHNAEVASNPDNGKVIAPRVAEPDCPDDDAGDSSSADRWPFGDVDEAEAELEPIRASRHEIAPQRNAVMSAAPAIGITAVVRGRRDPFY